jgi:hypothetical protein
MLVLAILSTVIILAFIALRSFCQLLKGGIIGFFGAALVHSFVFSIPILTIWILYANT